jgi:hypothetical protein
LKSNSGVNFHAPNGDFENILSYRRCAPSSFHTAKIQIRLRDSGASISLILEAKFPASRQKFPVPLLREFRRKPLNSLVSFGT